MDEIRRKKKGWIYKVIGGFLIAVLSIYGLQIYLKTVFVKIITSCIVFNSQTNTVSFNDAIKPIVHNQEKITWYINPLEFWGISLAILVLSCLIAGVGYYIYHLRQKNKLDQEALVKKCDELESEIKAREKEISDQASKIMLHKTTVTQVIAFREKTANELKEKDKLLNDKNNEIENMKKECLAALQKKTQEHETVVSNHEKVVTNMQLLYAKDMAAKGEKINELEEKIKKLTINSSDSF